MISKKIKFTSNLANYIPHPKPAGHFIPKEYKELDRFHTKNKSIHARTVKMCVPFLDAYRMGYIIPFPVDIHCFYDKDEQKMNFETSAHLDVPLQVKFEILSHGQEQVPQELRYNKRTVEYIFKFQNNWLIKTPPGYSCIFTQPFNQNFPFKVIDGVVDTDEHPTRINFPFYWTANIDERIILKHNTPMVQVIPFKRDDWKSEIEHADTETDEIKMTLAKELVDAYKKIVWSKKDFK